MKKKSTTAVALAVGAAVLLTACSGGAGGAGGTDSGSADGTVLTLGHAGNDTDARHVAALSFKDKVEAATDGAVTVEIYPSSTLGTWEEMVEGLQLGTTDIVIESMLAIESYTDVSGIETAPFLYENEDEFFGVWDGPLGDEIKDAATADSGYALLGNMYRGPRQLNTKQPVTSIGDLSGQTIRTPTAPTMLATWEALGARAEPLAANETYSALESGVLDGQENPLDSILFTSMYEVAPNISETSHLYANYHFIMWDDALASLPTEVQDAVRTAADEVGADYTAETVAKTDEYRSELEAGGATFHQITDRDAWVEAVEPVYGTLSDQVQGWIEQIKSGS